MCASVNAAVEIVVCVCVSTTAGVEVMVCVHQ